MIGQLHCQARKRPAAAAGFTQSDTSAAPAGDIGARERWIPPAAVTNAGTRRISARTPSTIRSIDVQPRLVHRRLICAAAAILLTSLSFAALSAAAHTSVIRGTAADVIRGTVADLPSLRFRAGMPPMRP
jgi:hypothetical protein